MMQGDAATQKGVPGTVLITYNWVVPGLGDLTQ